MKVITRQQLAAKIDALGALREDEQIDFSSRVRSECISHDVDFTLDNPDADVGLLLDFPSFFRLLEWLGVEVTK